MEVHSLAVPEHPFGLMAKVYREVFPLVHQELDKWKRKAETIQNPELKTQAKASIRQLTDISAASISICLGSAQTKQIS